jgi:hypothetical protein
MNDHEKTRRSTLNAISTCLSELLVSLMITFRSMGLGGWLVACAMVAGQTALTVIAMHGGVPIEVVAVGTFLVGVVSAALGYTHAPGRSMLRPAPGSVLVRIAPFIMPKRARERVLGQVIADMRVEYLDALQVGENWLSRWIWVRGHLIFWLAVLSYLGVSAVDIVKKVWVTSR